MNTPTNTEALPPTTGSSELSKACQKCGSEVTEKQWKNWRAKFVHYLKRDGIRRDGPFCCNKCRAAWMSDLADANYAATVGKEVRNEDEN